MFMVLKRNNVDLNLAFSFHLDDFDYTVHVTSDSLKCFGCGAEGHLVCSCPERVSDRQAARSVEEPPVGADGQPAAHSHTHSNRPPQNDTQNIEADTQNIETDTRGGGHGADGDQNVSNDEHIENEDMLQSPQEVLSVQAEVKEQTGHTATRVAESVLDEERVLDDELLKLAVKRKNPETKDKTVKIKKVSKTDSKCSSSQSEENTQSTQSDLQSTQESDCEEENMQVGRQSGYSFLRIRTFLKETNGVRAVKVEDFFPDLQLFHDSVRFFMRNTGSLGQPSFTDPEIFRLKILLLKVQAQIANDE